MHKMSEQSWEEFHEINTKLCRHNQEVKRLLFGVNLSKIVHCAKKNKKQSSSSSSS